jgi:hypothetical protein
MSLNFKRESPEWLPSLWPASRAQFEKQLAHSDHLRDVGEQLAE